MADKRGDVMIDDLINLEKCPIHDAAFRAKTKAALDRDGAVCLDQFLTSKALKQMVTAGREEQHRAYYTKGTHNVYLTPKNDELAQDHIFNRQVTSSKGCITTDQVPEDCGLHDIYFDEGFQSFIADIVGEDKVYPYDDPLSSINIHYASSGQELGWHFDNSSFAITLLLQKPVAGGVFEYVRDLRDADAGEMNFSGVEKVLDRDVPIETLDITPGTLVLFRGKNSMHRVTPTEGDVTRMLVVLAYNNVPGVALSENARMTFYGRLGT